jgi:hypothetical protein
VTVDYLISVQYRFWSKDPPDPLDGILIPFNRKPDGAACEKQEE